MLPRNRPWNGYKEKTLFTDIEKRSQCIAAALPASKQTVSIAGINRHFSDTVCVDHIWLEDTGLFQILDHYSRNPAAQIVSTTSFSEAFVVLEILWKAQFSSPEEVRGDVAFCFDVVLSFLAQNNIRFAPVSPRCHYLNLVKSKYGIIRIIYLFLKDAATDCDPEVHAVSAVWISNELDGSVTLLADEFAEDFP